MNRLEGIRNNRANMIFGNVTVILIRKNGKNIDKIRLIIMFDEIFYVDNIYLLFNKFLPYPYNCSMYNNFHLRALKIPIVYQTILFSLAYLLHDWQ